MEPTLTIKDLSVRYPDSPTAALASCDLSLQPGEHVALLGFNGSGKTTLLMAVAGLLPFSGEIWIQGEQVCKRRLRAIREKIGFLFGTPDDQLLFPQVLSDVSFALRRRGMAKAEAETRARGLLEDLDIGAYAHAEPHALSQGQRQRVALAGILVSRPPLLLLDEPSSALDPRGQRKLADFLADLPSAHLIATHNLAFATRCCDRFILLDRGKILSDTPDPLPATRYFQQD